MNERLQLELLLRVADAVEREVGHRICGVTQPGSGDALLVMCSRRDQHPGAHAWELSIGRPEER